MGNAQSDEPFKGKIYNLDPEPAPNIPPDPPKAAEQVAKPATVAAVIPAPAAAVLPAPAEQPPATQASDAPSLAPAVRPHEDTTASSYAQPAPAQPTHKMTRREKWVRAAQIITAISAGATVAVRCRQVRQKPLIRYTGADYQNLQWCAANGF